MASIQYITEVAGGKAAILAEAAQDPKIAKKRKPDQDQCATAVLKVVEKRAIAGAADLVRDDLAAALSSYTIEHDERFMADDPDEWDSGLDDMVEAIFAPYNDVLSADFLAINTIDTRMHEENGIERVANAFGKEVYKKLCWDAGTKDIPGKIKQPMQILASAGILTSDILGYFADRIEKPNTSQPVEQEPAAPTEKEMANLNDVIAKLRNAGLDQHTADGDFRELLGNACDSDDTLSVGAASQLGLDADDAVALQMLALDMGETEAVDHVLQLLSVPDAPEYVGGDTSGDSGWHLTPAAEPADDDYDYLGDVPAAPVPPPPSAALPAVGLNEAIKLFMDHGGTGAADAAQLVGVSRQTFNNYVRGSTEWKPDDEAKDRVLEEIERHMTGLDRARALLGGA